MSKSARPSGAPFCKDAVSGNPATPAGSPATQELNELVLGALYRHATFRNAVLPHRVSGAFFARYRDGMRYGPHVDDPVMGEGQRYRSDVAVTVFLVEPDAYDVPLEERSRVSTGAWDWDAVLQDSTSAAA